MNLMYDKDSLQITMLCGLLVGGADQELQEEEAEICFRYLDSHWDRDFGRQTQFLGQIETQRKKLVRDPEGFHDKMERLSEYVNRHFSGEQKRELLFFLREIINADGLIDPSESELFEIFQRRLKGVA